MLTLLGKKPLIPIAEGLAHAAGGPNILRAAFFGVKPVCQTVSFDGLDNLFLFLLVQFLIRIHAVIHVQIVIIFPSPPIAPQLPPHRLSMFPLDLSIRQPHITGRKLRSTLRLLFHLNNKRIKLGLQRNSLLNIHTRQAIPMLIVGERRLPLILLRLQNILLIFTLISDSAEVDRAVAASQFHFFDGQGGKDFPR